ncbi:MAG: DUF2284 domain-containing protein [Candidatus Aenigmatarchaeota archaeon]
MGANKGGRVTWGAKGGHVAGEADGGLCRLAACTNHGEIMLDCFAGIIPVKEVPTDRERFLRLCEDGCPNYGRCYSCPPDSPTFGEYVRGFERLLVVMFRADLAQVKNAAPAEKDSERKAFEALDEILAPEVDRIMRRIEKTLGGRHIAARNCALCEKCKKPEGKPCARPDDMRHCAVSLGIDCEKLAGRLFKKRLQWSGEDGSPTYISFICALPVKIAKNKDRIYAELKSISG